MEYQLDCLFIQAPNDPPSERSILIEPVDVLTLATYARHAGYTAAFHDLDRFGLTPLEQETCFFRVAIIILDYYIPLHTSRAIDTLENVLRLLQRQTQMRFLSGRLSSYMPHNFLDAFPMLDGCIIGEVEEYLPSILGPTISSVHKIQCKGVITRCNTYTSLSTIRRQKQTNIYSRFPTSGPIADRSLCQFHSYIDVHSIISSRGCTGRKACLFGMNI